MKHKAEGDGEYQIECPRDRTPVEQRVGAGPGLHGTELCDMRIVRVKDPFTEGVKQDIGCESGGKRIVSRTLFDASGIRMKQTQSARIARNGTITVTQSIRSFNGVSEFLELII